MYDKGSGTPIVVIPGMQGRWEWQTPALDALANCCHAISYSLGAWTFDDLVAEVDNVLDTAAVKAAALCGVSFGGMIAVRYAAVRPQRTTALVIVSAPSPWWQPSPTQARYIAKPWKSTPEFVATTWDRLGPEIKSACDTWSKRLTFCARHAARVVTAPAIPAHMAERIKLREEVDLSADCKRITAPTLVISGEPGLDRVVPVESTRRYAELIPGAKYAMIERTGHLGLVTRADRFAEIVCEFINASRP
jgi:pimeloyl-ACP methyl ester carboxylesterase